MPPVDDPLCRLKGRAVFEEVLRQYWLDQRPALRLKWPRFDKHHLDTYYMYEVIQALGGLEVVTRERKFAVVKRLLHISESYAAFSTTGRQHYEKWVQPCEDLLRREVENEYKRNGHYSDNFDWLHFATEEPLTDGSDQDRFDNQSEANKAVLRARYLPYTLDESENSGTFPSGLEASCPHTVRLDMRNHIIRMWDTDSRKRLDVYTAIHDIPDKYHGLANAVYTQLVIAGAINYGAVPFTTPVAVKFANDSTPRRKVAVIGAGFAGLTAARQLRAFGFSVSIIEARDRIGGRVHSTKEGGFSTDVDLGAMLITGIHQSPIALLARQTDTDLHILEPRTPLFDVDGSEVPKDIDDWSEIEYNATLDVTATYRQAMQSSGETLKVSLGTAFKCALLVREEERPKAEQNGKHPEDMETENSNGAVVGDTNGVNGDVVKMEIDLAVPNGNENEATMEGDSVDRTVIEEEEENIELPGMAAIAKKVCINGTKPAEEPPQDHGLVRRLVRWHLANLEYACAADLNSVSLVHWDQDDPFGFIGDHALVKNGCKPLVDALAAGLERNIRFKSELVGVKYTHGDKGRVAGAEVELMVDGKRVVEEYDAVVMTVPLGVLKAKKIAFEPALPDAKNAAIERLGCGGLMKVILEFPECFWIDQDMFGNLRENDDLRGEFYIFWNMQPCSGKPIIIGMVTEPAASRMEQLDDHEIVDRAMTVLRRVYPECPYPIAKAISRWGKDPYAHGVYTSITTGSSGVDYDILAAPVGNLFFAGEHTCRKYPTTCASAVISGLREAKNVVEYFGMVEKINEVHARALYDATHLQAGDDKRKEFTSGWDD